MPQWFNGVTTGGGEAANYNRNLTLLGNYGPAAAIAAGAGEGSAQALAYQSSGNGGGSLSNSFQDAWNQAKTANEKRYDQILGGYLDRYQRGTSGLASLGEYDRARLNGQFDRAGATAQQGLVGGAFNSTVRANIAQGNERERAHAQLGLNESLRREKLDVDSRLSGDTLGFMERRNDNYPDIGQYLGLAQAYGQSGGGGQGSGMSGAPIYDNSMYSIPQAAWGGGTQYSGGGYGFAPGSYMGLRGAYGNDGAAAGGSGRSYVSNPGYTDASGRWVRAPLGGMPTTWDESGFGFIPGGPASPSNPGVDPIVKGERGAYSIDPVGLPFATELRTGRPAAGYYGG